LQEEIHRLGPRAWCLQTDLSHPDEVARLIEQAAAIQPLDALVNNASIFEDLSLHETTRADWDRHLAVNLTAPFLLSQAFARQLPEGRLGRIVTLLDWRALRPGADHFPYTVSKAALAALTQSLAVALAPNITVNGLALGAILPPSAGDAPSNILKKIPAGQWGKLGDAEDALLFLLSGPAYITGEILHVDGGRHLV
jgi:NAD(P)-dependent dehydrogenase (short-subunit alcohol dehydrogenase family)